MLAYVFWHRPFAHIDGKAYEASMVRFLNDLAGQPPPGFIAAASFRIEATPWLGGLPGYEDWYLLEGSWALDPLNAYAVAAPAQSSHDSAAAQMEEGCGGIYAHVAGDSLAEPHSTLYWLTRPRGIQWRPPLDAVRAQCPQVKVWRRQMVLGAAGEFAIEVPGDRRIAVPPGWQARRVRRERLPR